jgi:general stress protein 26
MAIQAEKDKKGEVVLELFRLISAAGVEVVSRVRINRIWCRTCGRYFTPGKQDPTMHFLRGHDVIAEGTPYP